MYFTQFVGKDQRLVFEMQTAKPVTLDETSKINGEINLLVGGELITIRVGQDQLDEKSLYYLRTEQFKLGD